MIQWNKNHKPNLDICPERYCFNWVPPGGSADLSGKSYNSFEEAVEAGKKGLVFHNGGCASLSGPCRRATADIKDRDRYEPFNRFLKKADLPELFFCSPESLTKEDQLEYELMSKRLWNRTQSIK